MSTEIRVPVSPGELIDKITILEIKSERIADAKKLANVRTELEMLLNTWQASHYATVDVGPEWAALRDINTKLWVIEDDIREQERAKQFGARFIELARAVYVTNDERAAIKRKINDKLGSKIVEEKSYQEYQS